MTKTIQTFAAFLLMAMLISPGSVRAQRPDAIQDHRTELARAIEISMGGSWQEAQQILDQLAPQLANFAAREFAEFHLLEARHLALADRNNEALTRIDMLLAHGLADDQHLRALQFSANVAVLMRAYELAFEKLILALDLAGRVDDATASMATYGMAAYMFGRVGEHERAIEYGQLGVQLARATGQVNNECRAMQRLVPVYKWADKLVLAESSYRQAIQLCEEANNPLFIGVLRHGLADMLRGMGRLDEAFDLAQAAINDLIDSGFPLGEFEARLTLAEVLLTKGEHTTELTLLTEQTSAYFNKRQLFDQLARVEKLKAHIAAEQGDIQGVMAALERHLAANEKFLSRERAMLMGYLQVEFDLDIKARQITTLEENARLTQLQIESAVQQQRLRTIILLLSFVVLILLSFILWRVLRARQHFQHLSRHDRLSGLANHAWFFERADTLLKTPPPQGERLWLIAADIDHFKRINDRFGHLVGDQVLAQTARRLSDAFGEDALVGRVGGEEFAVLVQGTKENISTAIERFKQRAPQIIRQDDPQATLSFGISYFRKGESLTQLRDRADKTLYQAKNSGRNCSVFDDQDTF